MILLALDLDNTLIHSYRRAAENDVCVETMETENGIKKLSFMSPDAYRKFTSLSSEIIAVPITTRSQAQFGRISLFGNGTPLAVTANGGDLLVNGAPDREWRSISEALISPSLGELKRGAELLENDKNRSFEVRFVDESFMFTKSENVPETMKMLSESLDMNIVTLHENGSKVYILPKGLDKGSCLERLKKKLSPDITIAAGDSRFDIPMLAAADVPIVPHDFPSGSVNSDALTVCPYAQTGKFAEFILDFAENFYLKYRKNP